jgi:tetratricopeptide (TPR) repeat protein
MQEISKNFTSELRRRRVLPWAGIYIAVAWLIVEIAGFFLEQAQAPGWILRFLAIVFIVGLPVTLVLAWVIQVQPDGTRSIDSSKGQGRAIIGAIGFGVVATAALSWLILPRIVDDTVITDVQLLPNSVSIVSFAGADVTPNQSDIVETLYHALREGLNQTRDLTQVYLKLDAPPDDLAELGRRYRVGALLTGRIQSISGEFRITVQLFDVADNNVSWSRSVEWDPTRVVEIGSDIANRVFESLAVPTISRDKFAGTDNREAFDALVLGFRHQKAFNIAELRLAMAEFQRAIDLDPGYVRAYLGLAQTIQVYLMLKGPPEEERDALVQRQRDIVDAALALDEDNARSLSLLGFLTDNDELRLQAYERAAELDPYYGHNYFRLAWYHRNHGDFERAERLFRKALDFHPMSANYHSDLGVILWDLGRRAEAIKAVNRSIELEPRLAMNYRILGAWEYFHFGNIDEAVYNMRMAFSLDPESGRIATFVAGGYADLMMEDEALAWLERGQELSPTSEWMAIMVSAVHGKLGDEAFALNQKTRILELNPANRFALRDLASDDIAQGRWDVALERWRKAYPELVSAHDAEVNRKNYVTAQFFASNLLEAGLENDGLRLLEKCLDVLEDLRRYDESGDGDWLYWWTSIHALMQDQEATLAGLRQMIVENHQRSEPSWYSSPAFDFLKDDPEYLGILDLLHADLDAQRERLREMERNGEMPPAPGVNLELE